MKVIFNGRTELKKYLHEIINNNALEIHEMVGIFNYEVFFNALIAAFMEKQKTSYIPEFEAELIKALTDIEDKCLKPHQ